MSKYTTELDFSLDISLTLIAKKITHGSTVLEFGPSTGYLTKYLKEVLNCSVTAVEIDPVSAKEAEPYCKKIIIGNIDTYPWEQELFNERFDFIIFSDVLEHLYDPWEALKKAAGLLSKNGTLLTSIPNIAHSAIIMELLSGNFDYKNVGLLDKTHIRFFTRKTIVELLGSAGLKPIEWAYTKCSPKNTEFKIHYEKFHEPLQEILKKKEDSDVYQYITVSKKISDADTNSNVEVINQTQGFDRPLLSIWFFDKNGELYQNSFKFFVNDNSLWNKYSTVVNLNNSLTRIGLNPTDQPAICEISNLYLICHDKKIKIDLKKIEIYKAMQLKSNNSDVVKFISYGKTELHFLVENFNSETINSFEFEFKINRDFNQVVEETNSILTQIQPTKIIFFPDLMNTYIDRLNRIQYDFEMKCKEVDSLKLKIEKNKKQTFLSKIINKLIQYFKQFRP